MGLFSKLGKNKQEPAGAAQDSGYYTSADDQAASERARSKRASSADGAVKSRRSKDRDADDPATVRKDPKTTILSFSPARLSAFA